MPEETQVLDTPVVPDTPTVVPSAPTATHPSNDESSILKDLGVEETKEVKPKAKAKASDTSEEKTEEPVAQTDETDEHPQAEKMMRADYLKRLDQLNKEKAELQAERQRIEEEKAKLESSGKVDERDYGDETEEEEVTTKHSKHPLAVLQENPAEFLDPEDFEHESDQYLVGIVKSMAEQAEIMKRFILNMAQERNQMQEAQRQQYAESALRVMSDGTELVARKFGITPSQEEIGEAILEFGERIIASNGGKLTAEVALECWKRANVDLILASMDDTTGKKPKLPDMGDSSSARTQKMSVSDEEKMLQDMMGLIS